MNYTERTYSQYQKRQYTGQGLRNLGHDERDTCHLLILQNHLCLLACPALEKVILQTRCLECLNKAYAVHGVSVKLSHLHLRLESTILKRFIGQVENKEIKGQNCNAQEGQINIVAQHYCQIEKDTDKIYHNTGKLGGDKDSH